MPTPTPVVSPCLFVSKSIATRQVLAENTAFKQVIVLKNTGTSTWTGYTLVRLPTFGAANKATDTLGAAADSVKVPETKAGATATIELSLKAVKSNPKSGAAQAAPWELRDAKGIKVPIMTDATTQAKGGCVWTCISISSPPGANIPDLRNAAYTDTLNNKYVSLGYGGQCTAFVYARIKEKLKVSLDKVSGVTFGHNSAGQKWIDQLTGPGKPYVLNQTPRENSIAVWSYIAEPNNGHVAFVEAVDAAGKVNYNEANAISWQSFASDNGPDSDSWGGGYDGKLRVNTAEEMKAHLGPKQTLRGYIWL